MDVFQGLPSKSVPLCLTSWENQNKSAKTSEKILSSSSLSGSSVQTIVRKYKHHGPRSRHTAQERDAFCLLEMNVL